MRKNVFRSSRTQMLVIGASGMLGNSLFRYFSFNGNFDVYGTARSFESIRSFPKVLRDQIFCNVDVDNTRQLLDLLTKVHPEIIINCTGIIKQRAETDSPLKSIPINSLLPHTLAHFSSILNARLIHFSTDCVFAGSKGSYLESDLPDATDLYGRSKLLGEVDYPHAITLRTSLIGHELDGARSLINWFLKQEDNVRGFTKAIFSGLPTVEIARVIQDHVLPNPELRGLYHLSVDPISKHDLLSIVKDVYGKQIDIVPDDSLVIDRSLDSTRFRQATGFCPKSWHELVQAMREFG